MKRCRLHCVHERGQRYTSHAPNRCSKRISAATHFCNNTSSRTSEAWLAPGAEHFCDTKRFSASAKSVRSSHAVRSHIHLHRLRSDLLVVACSQTFFLTTSNTIPEVPNCKTACLARPVAQHRCATLMAANERGASEQLPLACSEGGCETLQTALRPRARPETHVQVLLRSNIILTIECWNLAYLSQLLRNLLRASPPQHTCHHLWLLQSSPCPFIEALLLLIPLLIGSGGIFLYCLEGTLLRGALRSIRQPQHTENLHVADVAHEGVGRWCRKKCHVTQPLHLLKQEHR